jgi:hypothetical protein
MNRGIKQLEWQTWSGNFSNSWQSIIPGFDCNYTIYIAPAYKYTDTPKIIVSGVDRKKTEHDSVQKAKEWCQIDFEKRINNLLSHD